MCLADALGLHRQATLHRAAINPLLDGNVGSGFQLEVALVRILAIVVLERALDVDRMRIVPFEQIRIVAIHRPHKAGERRDDPKSGSSDTASPCFAFASNNFQLPRNSPFG